MAVSKTVSMNMMMLFFILLALHHNGVTATISKSMYINWGAHHSTISGDDLQLVLDQSSGLRISYQLYIFN